MRVLHAVEDEDQRVLVQAVEHVGELDLAPGGVDLGDHALVAAGADEGVELVALALGDAHAGGLGLGEELAHARVLAVGGEKDLEHRVGHVAQLGGDGVEAVDQPGGRVFRCFSHGRSPL